MMRKRDSTRRETTRTERSSTIPAMTGMTSIEMETTGSLASLTICMTLTGMETTRKRVRPTMSVASTAPICTEMERALTRKATAPWASIGTSTMLRVATIVGVTLTVLTGAASLWIYVSTLSMSLSTLSLVPTVTRTGTTGTASTMTRSISTGHASTSMA